MGPGGSLRRQGQGSRAECRQHQVVLGHPGGIELVEIVGDLEESFERLRLSFVDVFILHSQIVPEPDPERSTWTTPLVLFQDAARPALQKLVEEGRIGAWGITAVQFPEVLETVLSEDPTPQVAQMIANVLDAPGDMRWSVDPVQPRSLVARAQQTGVGVMGIRAAQAGALTDNLDRDLEPDHPARTDFDRAAPFRALASEVGESAASLAHRYALTMSGGGHRRARSQEPG